MLNSQKPARAKTLTMPQFDVLGCDNIERCSRFNYSKGKLSFNAYKNI